MKYLSDIHAHEAPLQQGGQIDPVVMSRRQQKYLEAIKPYIEAKTKIYSLSMPTTIIHEDGNVEYQYNFTPEQQETLRLVDEATDNIKARIFGV